MLEKSYAKELHQIIDVLKKKRDIAEKQVDKRRLEEIKPALDRLTDVTSLQMFFRFYRIIESDHIVNFHMYVQSLLEDKLKL